MTVRINIFNDNTSRNTYQLDAAHPIIMSSKALDLLCTKWQLYKDLVDRAGLESIEFNIDVPNG